MRNLWSKNELIVCFCLYLRIPFGKIGAKSIEIIELAIILNRTPSSIAMRLSNFASIDPLLQQRGIKGLNGGFNQVKPIWDEYYNNQQELFLITRQILNQINFMDENSKLYLLLFKEDVEHPKINSFIRKNIATEPESDYLKPHSVLTTAIILKDAIIYTKLESLLRANKILEAVEVCMSYYSDIYNNESFRSYYSLMKKLNDLISAKFSKLELEVEINNKSESKFVISKTSSKKPKKGLTDEDLDNLSFELLVTD
jgi:hypothetical protein